MNTSQRNGAPESSPLDVIVVGGGLAGLTAAAYLGRAGRRVTLFERGAQLGGRARVQQRAGFHLNLGPHALYLGGAGARVLRELEVDWTGTKPPEGGVLTREDQRYAIPATLPGLLAYRGLSLRARLRTIRLFASIARGPLPPADLSFDAWLAQRRSTGALSSLFRAFLRLSTYVAASDGLSAEAGVMQLRQALSGVAYVNGGWASLVAGLTRCARDAGVTINTATALRAVQPDVAGPCVVLRDGSQLMARQVVLAVPTRDALKLLGPAASTQLQRTVRESQPVVAGCLDIGLRRMPRPGVALALDLALPRYMACHSVAAGLAPAGHALLQLAYYGEGGANARSRLEEWLDSLQPGWREEVVMQRWLPAARICDIMPSAGLGGCGGRPTVDAAGPEGISLCGDWVGPTGLLSDASFASAREASMRILRSTTWEHA